MYDQLEPIEYRFSLKKSSSFNGRSLLNINSSGRFTLLKEKINEDETSFTFENLEYQGNNTKDPLIFSPIVYQFNSSLNIAAIKNKKTFKPQWNRYRDKHRNLNNRVLLLVVEKLYFNTPLGMEYDAFSNGVYLPFFINSKGNYVDGEYYKGLNYISMPLDIPLETIFACKVVNEREIILEGWITLNEAYLDKLLLDQGFRSKAKDYHVSRDFSINSKISVIIDTVTNIIKQIKFYSSIKGENDLTEEIIYTVDTNFDSYQAGIHKIIEGKKYTLEEWQELERERKKPGRNFSLLDDD